METGSVLDAIGGFIAHLKLFAAKLPDIVHFAVMPTGMKPKLESIEDYEELVSRFRGMSGTTAYKMLNGFFVESLEAFEVGNLLGAVHPLLAALDHIERMHQDREIAIGAPDEKRITEYRQALHKILPGNKPELDGAGRGI
ncbi:hypothetical protein W02_26380 [Nitrospira sp. KM1]|uniref:hypothetical protein n=1 Tax=Nitrospira sp. KM1 TaxID=1936990 RepID=UPI0013A72DB1|nr:hypothetical protein [Nitrospira sp. KM1]BCA55498.1 hypothetical protein W02_26380 [Nitrospira sp. KM1]